MNCKGVPGDEGSFISGRENLIVKRQRELGLV